MCVGAAAAAAALQQDLADAKAHAAANGFADELLWWDVAFWAERLREAKYDLKDEELRPYFALPAVLEGLFTVRKQLLAVAKSECV